MRKSLVIGAAILLLGAIAALLVPMWTMTSGMELSGHGWTAIVLMLIFCFGIAGALMFLIFYSARHGHDEAAHFSGVQRDPPLAGVPGIDASGPAREPAPRPGIGSN